MPSSMIRKNISSLFRPRCLPIILAFLLVLTIYLYVSHILHSTKYLFTPDDYGYVQHAIHHLFKRNKPTVIVLGGSSGREAFLPSEEITKNLSTNLQQDIQFFNLASSSQTLLESLAILSTLNCSPNTLVILVLSTHGLSQSPEEMVNLYQRPRLPFLDYTEAMRFLRQQAIPATPLHAWQKNKIWLNEILDIAAHRSHIHAKKNQYSDFKYNTLLLHEVVSNGVMGHYTPYAYVYADRAKQILAKPLELSEKQRLRDTLARNLKTSYPSNKSLNLQLINHFLTVAKKKKNKVVLLMLPRDPITYSLEDDIFNDFKVSLKKENINNYELIDYSKLTQFSSESFFDLHHMMPSGRRQFNPFFLDMVKTQLEIPHDTTNL